MEYTPGGQSATRQASTIRWPESNSKILPIMIPSNKEKTPPGTGSMEAEAALKLLKDFLVHALNSFELNKPNKAGPSPPERQFPGV